jgi:sialate O-acetylesterase
MILRTFTLLIAAALASALTAQSLRVTGGVTDYQVIQRNLVMGLSAETAITVSGTATVPDGREVEARSPVGRNWTKIATVQSGRWSGKLNLNAGGPYNLEFRVVGEPLAAVVEHVLVGDLWILAGQSNMEGVGDLVDVQQPSPKVNMFDQTDRWRLAEEPLHRLVDAADRVHWRLDDKKQPVKMTGEALTNWINARRKGAGLGLPFAVTFATTGIPVGLVPCAHGGTSMDQWSPALKDKAGDSLYGAMYRRFQAVGGKVAGILWYQGESDANPKAAPEFARKFGDFVTAVRRDFNDANLPFYYVQIGRFVSKDAAEPWNTVQEEQRLAQHRIPNLYMVSSITSELDDLIHVSTADLKRQGMELGMLARSRVHPGFQAEPVAPEPSFVRREGRLIRVGFENGKEGLRAPGRVAGFTIHDAAGAPLPLIYRAQIDPIEPMTVRLYLSADPPPGATLRYGYGRDPYCNLTDGRGFAVPVFGPLPLPQ